jgi:DNA-binding NarL/FixJ family response regulator
MLVKPDSDGDSLERLADKQSFCDWQKESFFGSSETLLDVLRLQVELKDLLTHVAHRLTPREKELLMILIKAGDLKPATSRIAKKMRISPATVRVFKHSLFRKILSFPKR